MCSGVCHSMKASTSSSGGTRKCAGSSSVAKRAARRIAAHLGASCGDAVSRITRWSTRGCDGRGGVGDLLASQRRESRRQLSRAAILSSNGGAATGAAHTASTIRATSSASWAWRTSAAARRPAPRRADTTPLPAPSGAAAAQPEARRLQPTTGSRRRPPRRRCPAHAKILHHRAERHSAHRTAEIRRALAQTRALRHRLREASDGGVSCVSRV